MALKLADALRSSYATPTVVSEDVVDVLHEAGGDKHSTNVDTPPTPPRVCNSC